MLTRLNKNHENFKSRNEIRSGNKLITYTRDITNYEYF